MNFRCPYCQNEFIVAEVSLKPTPVQCPSCGQVVTVVAPNESPTANTSKSGWATGVKFAIACGALALIGFGLVIALALVLRNQKTDPIAKVTSTDPVNPKREVRDIESDIESPQVSIDKIPEIARAAFEGRRRSHSEMPFEELTENYRPFQSPTNAKHDTSFQLAKLYVANFGSHLKSYSSKHPPGCRTRVEVYLPNDLSDDAKIPCVLIAPAGTNLLTGSACDDLTYTDEILPYLREGMAVVHYSIDGPLVMDKRIAEKMFPGAFKAFASAHGGVVNGQRALDFVLEHFDQIDSGKIYCAGHSSAATLALQLASTDTRISRCVAYAPAPYLERRFGEFLNQPGLEKQMPMLKQYVRLWSPDKRIAKFHCPIMIFHARDDSNTPYRDTKAFCDLLTASGKTIKLVSCDRGGHYQSMINEGLPAAVKWLQSNTEE